MAKFTPGAVISEIRGTVASSTFSKNASGAILRNRVKPINRRSVGQSGVRQSFGSISSGWRGLTQAQREAFIAAAPDFPYQDSLGQTKTYTGSQLYQSLNRNRAVIGEAPITSPPSATSFPVLGVTTGLVDSSAIEVQFTPDPVPAGFALAIYATRPLSAGVSAVGQSDFRIVSVVDPATASPADVLAEYTALFGGIADRVGQKIFFEIKAIEVASGLAGVPLRTSALITQAI